MSTNAPEKQAEYQRRHRAKKKAAGLCCENGCRNDTPNYRCEACQQLKKERECTRNRL